MGTDSKLKLNLGQLRAGWRPKRPCCVSALTSIQRNPLYLAPQAALHTLSPSACRWGTSWHTLRPEALPLISQPSLCLDFGRLVIGALEACLQLLPPSLHSC